MAKINIDYKYSDNYDLEINSRQLIDLFKDINYIIENKDFIESKLTEDEIEVVKNIIKNNIDAFIMNNILSQYNFNFDNNKINIEE